MPPTLLHPQSNYSFGPQMASWSVLVAWTGNHTMNQSSNRRFLLPQPPQHRRRVQSVFGVLDPLHFLLLPDRFGRMSLGGASHPSSPCISIHQHPSYSWGLHAAARCTVHARTSIEALSYTLQLTQSGISLFSKVVGTLDYTHRCQPRCNRQTPSMRLASLQAFQALPIPSVCLCLKQTVETHSTCHSHQAVRMSRLVGPSAEMILLITTMTTKSNPKNREMIRSARF